MSKITFNVFGGNFVNHSSIDEKDLTSLREFISFKNNDFGNTSQKISFKQTINLSMKFKCINWFEYHHSKYLSFDILKVREYDTNITYYFQFIKHNYKIYPKSLVKKTNELNNMYKIATDVNSGESNIFEIYKLELTNCKELGVEHYKRYKGKNEFLNLGSNIMKDINNIKISDFVIFKTAFNQRVLLTDSPIENSFRDFRFLSVLYNINPSGSYQIDNLEVRQSDFNDKVFYVDTNNIKNLFKNPLILSKDVQRNWISFDIESECVSYRPIDSELNIITHLGFEYFCDNYYTDFKTHKESFNFCFINIDFHLRSELKKKDVFDINNTDMDIVYNNIRKKDYSLKISKAINEELEILKKDPLSVIYENQDILELVKTNKIKYVFCSELEIIILFKKLLKDLEDVDCILSFNGHSYDFQQLARKFHYLTNKTISKEMKYLSLYSEEQTKFFTSENPNTGFNIINMEMNQHYYSIDLFNYVLKFKPNFDSFSLKEVAKLTYNIRALVQPIKNNIFGDHYKINIFRRYKDTISNTLDIKKKEDEEKKENEYTKTLYKFIQVLLSSNYCYINDTAYRIINKEKFIKDDQNIYEIDIIKTINQTYYKNGIEFLQAEIYIIVVEGRICNLKTDFIWENYFNYIEKVSLAKDDIEISDRKIFEKQTTFDIARYCIHDSLLCRYLMKDFSIKENNDVFTQIYYLPQSKAFLFRNSTNFLGYLFKTCYEEKSFLLKNNKICTKNYTGGKVFEPQEHFLKEPVMLFDFESLYPSIMINCNISPDTLILVLDLNCMLEFTLVKSNIEKLFDRKKYTIIYNIRDPVFTIMVFTKIYSDGSSRKGLLSYMLSDLKIKRVEYKKRMKQYYKEGNSFQYINCDMIQNCIKILMNSVYGLLGSDFHNISCKFTSQAVTSIGVSSISFLADYFDKAILEDNKIIINNNINYNPICSKYIEPNKVFELDTGIKDKIELKIVYGDTDSIMIIPKGINKLKDIYNQPEDIYKKRAYYYISCIGNKICELINKNILEGNLNLEFEAIYFDMIIMAKKKYKSLKVEPISTNNKLTLIEIDSLKPDFKEDNKGISLKRRDNCNFQKNCIMKLYKIIHEKINDLKFIDNDIDYDVITREIINFIKKIRIDLILDVLNNKINLNDFIITSSYRGIYKSENNTTLLLVMNYNKNAREQINKGDRFKFIFKKTFNPNNTSLESFNNLPEDKRIKAILNTINWTYIEDDISSYREICDETTNLEYKNGERVFIEIYLSKIRKDINTIFINNENIFKSLVKEEKCFIANNY